MGSILKFWNTSFFNNKASLTADLKKSIQKQELRSLYIINNVRMILYAIYTLLDLIVLFMQSDKTPANFSFIEYCFTLSLLYGLFWLIYKLTRSSTYHGWLKYISVCIDYSIIFFIASFFVDFFETSLFTPREFMIGNTLFIIMFNFIYTFLGSRAMVVFTAIGGCILNMINFLRIGNSDLFNLYTTFAILLISGLLYMVAAYIQKNQILARQLERKNRDLNEAIKEIKETQSKLIDSEKMATTASLVTGLSHEINSPLGIAVTSATDLKNKIIDCTKQYKNNTLSRGHLQNFLKDCHDENLLTIKHLERAAELIQRFKKVSSDQISETQRIINLKCYLEDIFSGLGPVLRKHQVSVEIVCANDIVLNSYPGFITQIMTNLTINAISHGFDSEQSDKKIQVDCQRQKDNRLLLQFQDNGNGLPVSLKNKVFDPFYTRDKQNHTGLGLHIIKNMITQKMDGTIDLVFPPEKGLGFRILLPITLEGTASHE